MEFLLNFFLHLIYDSLISILQIGIEENIGEVYKVRVGFKDAENEMSWYEGSTEAPSWFLEKVNIMTVKFDIKMSPFFI